MLGKKFYDVLALVFVVLLIGLTYYSGVLVNDAVQDAMNSGVENMIEVVEADYRFQISNYIDIGTKVLAGIYWIFMVVLVIGLHKVKKTSMLDIILVVVLSPLAIVFYFLTLRPRLKEVESSSIQS